MDMDFYYKELQELLFSEFRLYAQIICENNIHVYGLCKCMSIFVHVVYLGNFYNIRSVRNLRKDHSTSVS